MENEKCCVGGCNATSKWSVRLEHNYFKEQDEEEYLPDQCQLEQGLHEEHNYFKEHLADNIISPLLMKNVSSSDQPSTCNIEVKEVAEFQNALYTHNSAVVSVPEIMSKCISHLLMVMTISVLAIYDAMLLKV